jgi:aminoacylase
MGGNGARYVHATL